MEELSHLIHDGQLSLTLYKSSAMYSAVFQGEYPAYKRIRLAHTTGRNPVMITGIRYKLVQQVVNNPRFVTFSFCEWYLQNLMKPYKDKLMVILDEEAPLAWSGMPMRFGWPQGKILKRSMLRIDETGIFRKFFKEYEPIVDTPLSKNLNREPIFKLSEFLPASLVLAYGFGPGIAVFLLEILWTSLDFEDIVFNLISIRRQ